MCGLLEELGGLVAVGEGGMGAVLGERASGVVVVADRVVSGMDASTGPVE